MICVVNGAKLSSAAIPVLNLIEILCRSMPQCEVDQCATEPLRAQRYSTSAYGEFPCKLQILGWQCILIFVHCCSTDNWFCRCIAMGLFRCWKLKFLSSVWVSPRLLGWLVLLIVFCCSCCLLHWRVATRRKISIPGKFEAFNLLIWRKIRSLC